MDKALLTFPKSKSKEFVKGAPKINKPLLVHIYKSAADLLILLI